MLKCQVVFCSLRYVCLLLLCMLMLPVTEAFTQTRFEGSAVVQVDDGQYTVAVECDDAMRPELGFSTEPNRITRERTGRTNQINIRLRSSGQEDEIIVSLDRYVAWLAQPTSAGGTLKMTLDMSPVSITKDGQPALLTRDMWMDGERPEGITDVSIEARCSDRDPEAPSYRKISG